ncbi:MAG TPA: LamG-like jellyroll fold domain-containing protein [Rariglobus sp.]|nr:LamG-like jellyroll fold domain-containing protein [Rariglobus sp.]
MITRFFVSILALSASALLVAEPAPVLSWNFNEVAGDFTANTGSGGAADLYLVGPGGGKTPAFSVDARGVSGKPGDHAFDLTSSTGMGANTPNSTGPTGVVWSKSPGLASLPEVSSFTLTGWIMPTATVTNAARLVSSSTITLMAGVENRITLQVNGTSSSIQSEPAYDSVGNWIFVAVTYDGTRATDNVTYYVGSTEAGSLAKAGTVTVAAGKLKPLTGQFLIGNNSTNSPATRPFMGLIDNIALYASRENSAGVLSLDQIESIRAAATR